MVQGHSERIFLIVESIFKRQGLDRANVTWERFGRKMRTLATQANIPLTQMASQLDGVNVGITKQGKYYDLLSGKQVNNANVVNRLTLANKRFKMEMLGVMFFGMAVSALMFGMLRPAMDMVGIFDILNITLGVGFLPLAMAMLEPMLGMMTWFIGLPEPVRLVIGMFVSLIGTLGTALFVLGQMSLGLTSLSQAWAGILAQGGLKKVTVKFLKDGWTSLKSALFTFGSYAGKVIKTTVQFAHKGYDIVMGKLNTISTKASTGAKFVVMIVAALAAWLVGTWIGNWIKENILKGQPLIPFMRETYPEWALDAPGKKPLGYFGDMIWRPGQDPIAISPDDTIVASKSGIGGGGDTYNISIDINASGMDINELTNEIGDRIESDLRGRSRI